MSDYLKRILQAVLVQRRHRLYEERLAEQAVPHDVWLKGVLEQEGAEIAAWKDKTGKRVQKAVWEVR